MCAGSKLCNAATGVAYTHHFAALISAGNTMEVAGNTPIFSSSSSASTKIVLKSPELPQGLVTLDSTSELADHIIQIHHLVNSLSQLPIRHMDWTMTSILDYQLQ